MWRHLIPRFEAGGWTGAALTYRPGGGVELPPGLSRSMRQAFGQPTIVPVCDDIDGGILCIQWLGVMIEIGVGRVR